MAAQAVGVAVEVIGLVGSVLGIVQFGQDMMPSGTLSAADSSSLRIGLGLDGVNLSQSEGIVGNIKVYNENQIMVGAGSGDGFMGDGGFQDINIDQHYGPGKQPTYVQINGADDAVCIAYIMQTWPDGKQRGWLGDMGYVCGAHWGYSNVVVDDNNYKPFCTWIDQNHDNGNPYAGIQIHMSEFNVNSNSTYSKDMAHYCSWPTMYLSPSTDAQGMPDNQIWGSPKDKTSVPAKPRAIKTRSPALASTIIGSQDASHSALKLCQSETSHGSDFVSFHEGVFCDMETKTPWPLCSDSVKDDCYRWETHTLIDAGGHTAKNYDNIQHWR